MKIAAYGWYNHHNLGDDLIEKSIRALCIEISTKSGVSLEPVFVTNAAKSRDEYYGLYDFFLEHVDLLLLGGGGIIPYASIRKLAIWMALTAKCRRYSIIGAGIDPIPRHKFFFKRILRSAQQIIVRDKQSVPNLLGVPAIVSTDLVIAAKDLLFTKNAIFKVKNNENERCIWVCLKADTDSRHIAWYNDLLTQLKSNGSEVKIVAFGQKDYDYAKNISQVTEVILTDVSNVGDVFARIGEHDVVLAERYHGIILSLIFRKRFVPLIYDYKHLYLLDDIGFQYERHLLNYDEQGYLAKLHQVDAGEVVYDLIGARDRDYTVYFERVDGNSKSARSIYLEALGEMIQVAKND